MKQKHSICYFLELSKMILSIRRFFFYLRNRLKEGKTFDLVLNLHLTCSLSCPDRSTDCLPLSLHERWPKTCVLQVSFGNLQHLGASVLYKFSVSTQITHKLCRRGIGFCFHLVMGICWMEKENSSVFQVKVSLEEKPSKGWSPLLLCFRFFS